MAPPGAARGRGKRRISSAAPGPVITIARTVSIREF